MTARFSFSAIAVIVKRFRLITIACILFPLFAMQATAQQARPSDKQSDGQFTGIALVTNDPVWYEQFNRPETPSLAQITSVAVGERGVIATLFSNPTLKNGNAKVECSLSVTQPDGTSQNLPSGICYEGPARPANVLYPSLMDIQFEVTATDPVGFVTFNINMKDAYSDKAVTLTVTFLQGGVKNDS